MDQQLHLSKFCSRGIRLFTSRWGTWILSHAQWADQSPLIVVLAQAVQSMLPENRQLFQQPLCSTDLKLDTIAQIRFKIGHYCPDNSMKQTPANLAWSQADVMQEIQAYLDLSRSFGWNRWWCAILVGFMEWTSWLTIQYKANYYRLFRFFRFNPLLSKLVLQVEPKLYSFARLSL